MRIKRSMKIYAAVIAVFILLICCGMQAAAAEAGIISTQVCEDMLYLYVRGAGAESEASVQIGSTVMDSDDVCVEELRNLENPMRTVILVDNSLSIPETDRSEIGTLLSGLIAGRMDGELLRIGTYSDEIVWQCEYTSDAAVLTAAASGIVYEKQSAYLSDVLYGLISELKAEEDGAYTRILVVTDGADDQAIGYTNDEVRSMIGESGLPVYAVGVLLDDNSSELETLFSFSRASSAEYYLLEETDTEEILESLLWDQDNLRIGVTLSASLMDGSSRSIRLQLTTGGETTVMTTIATMPFGNAGTNRTEENADLSASAAVTASESGEDTEDRTGIESGLVTDADTQTGAVVEADAAAETENAAESEDITETETMEVSLSHWIGPIACVSGVTAVLAIIVLLILSRRNSDNGNGKRRQRDDTGERNSRRSNAADRRPVNERGGYSGGRSGGNERRPRGGESLSGGETLLGGAGDDEATMMMGCAAAERHDFGDNYLMLTNLERPGIRYRAALDGPITVGRRDADIVIEDDPEVSRTHCTFEYRGNSLYLEDDGARNGTVYEGRRLVPGQKAMISAGGRVKIGRYTYSADLMQKR